MRLMLKYAYHVPFLKVRILHFIFPAKVYVHFYLTGHLHHDCDETKTLNISTKRTVLPVYSAIPFYR